MSEKVFLWCPECEEAGVEVYLWERPGPDRGAVLATFPHGTEAVARGWSFSPEEERHYCLAEVDGRGGYVPQSLVKKA